MNSFSLSTPELLSLLYKLEVRTIMGLPVDPYIGMDRSAFVETLAEGMRRFCDVSGYGDPSDPNNPRATEIGEMELVLSVCGTCNASLVASERRVDEEKGAWRAWHRSAEFTDFIVEYQRGEDDIHHFLPLEKKTRFYERLWALFPQVGNSNSSRPIAIPTLEDLKERSLASDNLALKDALLEDGTWQAFSSLRYNGSAPNEVTILKSPQHAWLFSNAQGTLSFTPANPKMLKMLFVNLAGHFLA